MTASSRRPRGAAPELQRDEDREHDSERRNGEAATVSISNSALQITLTVGERQLDVGFAVVLILLQRESDVERGFVLGEVVVPLGRAPGDRAENAALLLERHLEVALLQLSRTVDDLDAARGEHRPRIAGAERRQRRRRRPRRRR